MAALLEPARVSFLMVAMLSLLVAYFGAPHVMVIAGLAMLLPSGMDFLFVKGPAQYVGALNVLYLLAAVWLGVSHMTFGNVSSYNERP